MTFFIKEKTDLVRRGPNVALPSNAGGVGAAITSYFREIDTFNGASALTETEKMTVGKDAGERLGIDRLNQWYQENDAGYDHIRKPPATVDDFIAMHGERGSDMILDIAREEAAKNPGAWADLDLSNEGIDARVTERLKEADQADAEMLALSPNPVRNALLGGLAAGVLDPVNLAAIPLGLGGGSILRVMAREALINGAIEAVQHPTRVKTADRLDKAAPSLIESVATGMAFGAVAGGVLDGIPKALRALAYYREIKKTAPDPTLPPVTQEAAIQSAEKAIVDGKDPLEVVRSIVTQEPAPVRRPLVLDESMAVTPEPTALAPDPITTTPLEPAEASRGTREVLNWLRKRGVDPNGWLGTELKSRGMTSRTVPGLFKRGGENELDNIPFVEVDPAVANRVGRADDGLYLDRNGVLRAIDEELRPSRPPRAYSRDYVPERAWADPDLEDRGWMVRFDDYDFIHGNNAAIEIERDFDAYLAERGYTILPRERDEILSILTTRGGDAEDLLHSAMSRELDEADYATLRSMRDEGYGRRDVPWPEEGGLGAGADRAGRGPAGEPQTAARDATEPGARGGEPQGERTEYGEQFLVPGTRRVDEYSKHVAKARAEAKRLQSAMRSGKPQERVEDDVGGLFGGAQREMFSDPADPKSKPTQIAMMEDLRGTLEAEGDFKVDVGNGPVKASTLLRELDDDLDFEDILNACGKRGPA